MPGWLEKGITAFFGLLPGFHLLAWCMWKKSSATYGSQQLHNFKRCASSASAGPYVGRKTWCQVWGFCFRRISGCSVCGVKSDRVCAYIYICSPPPQDLRLRIRGSWGMGCTKHCNAQKIPKFLIPNLTKPCNAQKIPKIPKFWHLCPGQDQIPKKIWNF